MLRPCLFLLALAAPAHADVWSFNTPSGNIECIVGEDTGGSDIECTIFQRGAVMAQYPACPASRGLTVSMGDTGGVTVACAPAGSRATGAQDVANYGVEGKFGGFTCLSATSGLQCRNGSGHGFHLSRTSQSIF